MDSVVLTTSTSVLVRISFFALYFPVCLLTFWKLVPRLSLSSKWIAGGMLAAQIVVIIVSLELRPISEFEWWLWNLDREWNIPSTLASIQLAMVAGVALATAWLAKFRPAWQRLYLVGIGVVFLFFAQDEYFSIHEAVGNWATYYSLLGALMMIATLFVTARSPRGKRIWYVCLLIGLGMSASGAMAFESHPNICGSWGVFHFNGCLSGYRFEETLEFLGIWLALVAVLGLFSDEIPAPRPAVRRALSLWPVIWVLVLVHGTAIPRVELRYLARRIPVQFERGVQLHGYHIEQKDNRVILRLFPTAERNDYDELGYSVHLVDQVSGESLARLNQAADSQIGLLGSPGHAHLYRQILEVEIPPETPANRALWVALALWHGRFTEFEPLAVRNTKLQLLSDSQFVLDEMILPDLPETRDGLPVATFESGFTLQSFDMPDRAQPGETLGIKFSWHAEEPGNDDLIQFLHLGHEESGNWWVYDQQPLGARLPTRLWYSGLADSEMWNVQLPADLAPGQYAVYTGLYRTRDLERVPASDADGNSFLDGRIPLGTIIIE